MPRRDVGFRQYATLDIENLALLESLSTQIQAVLPSPRAPEQEALVRKLRDAVHDARMRFHSEAH